MNNHFIGWLGLLGALATVQGTAFAENWGEREKLQDFLSLRSEQLVTNLYGIQAMGISGASLPLDKRPWSDTFWPDTQGSIADPYNEVHSERPVSYVAWALSGGNSTTAWRTIRTYVAHREDLHQKILSHQATQEEIDNLSPAEKYDLLLGDANFTMYNRVIHMVDTLGSSGVELLAVWSGVCHGWSPASMELPRPLHVAPMQSPLGFTINFYPADIKGLASFLWGKTLAQNLTKVEGFQCQTGAKATRYGRLADPRCFDVNPAFFHLMMVNQIGINQHGFVMDRNYRSEVQNQPVWAYRSRFYKITDRSPSPGMTIDQAKVRPGSDTWDPYRHYRNPRTAFIVGVETTLWYGKENGPNHERTDDNSKDVNKEFTTRYDLELDANGEIIGGEWKEYNFAAAPTLSEAMAYEHPDIIWLVPNGVKAWSVGDANIHSYWDGTGPVPQDWRSAAIFAASLTESQKIKGKQVTMPRPQPLAKVVDLLIERSRR